MRDGVVVLSLEGVEVVLSGRGRRRSQETAK